MGRFKNPNRKPLERIDFTEAVAPGILHHEVLWHNPNTGKITYVARFRRNNLKIGPRRLKEMMVIKEYKESVFNMLRHVSPIATNSQFHDAVNNVLIAAQKLAKLKIEVADINLFE